MYTLEIKIVIKTNAYERSLIAKSFPLPVLLLCNTKLQHLI